MDRSWRSRAGEGEHQAVSRGQGTRPDQIGAGGRNKSSYDDPRVGNSPIVGFGVNLAAKMIKIATESLPPPPATDQPGEQSP